MSTVISKNLDTLYLSSETRICKTERFVKETARFTGVDFFITQFAEGLISDQKLFSKLLTDNYYRLVTTDQKHAFYVAIGLTSVTDGAEDVIFYSYEDKGDVKRKNDLAFVQYLENKKQIEFSVFPTARPVGDDFAKLYLLSSDDQVNFPLLNEEQLKIVTTENVNVLAQGVAGSGKTNVCIDKIVFSAARNYHGKVLYTTFSRGLLIDTESKIKLFRKNVLSFKNALDNNKVRFVKGDKKRAVEARLGIFLNVDTNASISEKLGDFVNFLDNNVEFKLLSDFAADKTIANEDFFVKKFLQGANKFVLSKIAKIPTLNYEIIYKEIYGLILGCNRDNSDQIISLEDYVKLRENSFSKRECEVIYSVALDYVKFLESQNATDNNLICKKLLPSLKEPWYSLSIIDEVQDFTEINLAFISKISRKVFAVGDALQMINPSYFSFAYLKRLLYDKEEMKVAELKNNYRNTRSITDIVNTLSDLNVKKFGLHNFILKGTAIGNDQASAVFFKDDDALNKLAKEKPNPFTIVVTGVEVKNRLRKSLPKQEILTVSEIKGLERDTVLLYDLLSDNYEKWRTLEELDVNRKKADENSVYRYYFNLFYVGISRAKRNLFVTESKSVKAFEDFFKQKFDCKSTQDGIKEILKTVSKVDVDRDELLERIEEFLKFGQFDNATYTANRLEDDTERVRYLDIIKIYEQRVYRGDYKGAGIAYWEMGELERAKKYFALSGDEELIKLVDEVAGKGDGKLTVDIARFYPELKNNERAKELILNTLKSDLDNLKNELKDTRKILQGARKNGKK